MQLKHWIDEQKDLQVIFQLLENNARLVGGCVRDFILYGKLVYDIDIATPFLPDEIIARLGKKFKVIPTGLQHGTITIMGKHKYEITTLRKDEETDGRHATVSFDATWQEDSARRDFTINALYADSAGNIYDYHNGLADLENNTVRFINDPIKRIEEDYLRIMRFFRFVIRFGGYDQESLKACIALCGNLSKISRERITQEWLNLIPGRYFWQWIPKMRPILEVIGVKTEVMQLEGLTTLGTTSLFWQPSSMLLLSNAQKKYIRNLIELPLTTQTQAIIYAREYGKEFIQDKMILTAQSFDLPDLGPFPINGSMLMQKGLKGPAIGKAYARLYRFWIEKLGNITVQELLERV